MICGRFSHAFSNAIITSSGINYLLSLVQASLLVYLRLNVIRLEMVKVMR